MSTFAAVMTLALWGSFAGVARARPEVVAAAIPGSGARLDPFHSRSAAGMTLNPYRRLAQAPTALQPASASCTADNQCPRETVCDAGACRPLERQLDILLYRKRGASTAFIPFYWARRGNPGYRVVAPLYWHFWSPTNRTQIFAPFFWRFEDHLLQQSTTVVLLYSHTHQPGADGYAVWPFFYASNKLGWAAPLLGSFKINDPEAEQSYGVVGFLYLFKRDHKARTAFDLLFPLFVSKRSHSNAFTFALPLNFYWRSDEDSHLLALPLFYRGTSANSAALVSPLGYTSRSGQNHRGALAWLYWYGRERTSSYDVLFPLLWSFRSENSSTTVLPPFVYSRQRGATFTTLFPIYWGARNQERGSGWHFLLPLFFSKSSDHGRGLTWVTPLGGYHRDAETRSVNLTFLVPPLVIQRNSEREFDMALLLYWHYTNRLTEASTTLVGPFYRSADPSGSTTVLFPLFWHFRDSAANASAHSLLPFYFHRHGPGETTTAAGLFPLWGYARHFDDGWAGGLFPLAFFGSRGERRHAVVFPLLFHVKDERSSTTLALPLFYRTVDQNHGQTAVFPLLFVQGHDHSKSFAIQFPLFWRFHDEAHGSASTVIPPLFWQSWPDGWAGGIAPLLFARSSADKGSLVLFPLFWHFRNQVADSQTTVVLNYLHRRVGDETTDALFPLVHYRRGARPGGSDETSFTLFPLLHYRRDPVSTVFASPVAAWTRSPARKAGFALPYFWYQDQQVAAQGVPLLYLDYTRLQAQERTRMWGPFVQVDAPGRQTRVLFPLFGHHRDEEGTKTFLFPTYVRLRYQDGDSVDTLPPLFWFSRGPRRATQVIGPAFRSNGQGGHWSGLFPLWLYARSAERRLLVAPLLYNRESYRTGESKTWAGLLFYHSSGPTLSHTGTTTLFPLWWSHHDANQSRDIGFPLFWHFSDKRDDSSTTVAGPLLWGHRGSWNLAGLLPVAFYASDSTHNSGAQGVFPLYYASHAPGRSTFGTALFGAHSAADSHWWYFWPVYHRDGWTSAFTMVFPLWFGHTNKTTETTTRVIPPLLHYARVSPDRSVSGWLGLFWHSRDLTSSTTVAFPLFYDWQAFHDRRTTILFPFFMRYHREQEGTTYTLAPLYWHKSAGDSSSTVLFPLVWDFRSGDRTSTVVFPFYAGFQRPNYRAQFFFPSIYYRRGRGVAEGTYHLVVFPFWESAASRRGDSMWEVLLGLVGYERAGRNRFLKLLFLPFELEPVPAAQATWYGKTPRSPRLSRARGVDTQVW